MRVITGTAKGRKLKTISQKIIRPITDRVKESLFSILGDWIIDTYILDLFGGTGAVGIEALSRGAMHVTFVETAHVAWKTIKTNLKLTCLASRATVIRGDAFKFLANEHACPYDIIYVAPPQYRELWLKALRQIDEQPDMLTEEGIVIIQIHPKEFEHVTLQHLTLYQKRKYGSTILCFYEK
ncbi:MAG: 16S rRNA (guanine(966)-N(2))-methyltransferase RsmD [Anaerolineaceae bacterium 4572_78]|nr:MAG: 16S rRNA (guanine(966)-N(2))-methyltransferase RsmD [Anaerolineaceae bacterium 4572_78]